VNVLVPLFERLDAAKAEKQLEYLQGNALKTLNDQTADFSAKIVELEAAGNIN
jgi:hypothetical protein